MNKKIFLATLAALTLLPSADLVAQGAKKKPTLYKVKKFAPESKRGSAYFDFGTGDQYYRLDERGLYMSYQDSDDKLWHYLPVMGEVHYSRLPETDWWGELLKMKAGGITIVSCYVFWNHHEFEQGKFDWKGNRNLRKFVSLCGQAGLNVVLRIGPFCHGEAYQGGIPDWITANPAIKPRTNQKEFMDYVGKFFRQIGYQTQGQYGGILGEESKDSPIIGVQIENESRGPWLYLQALKDSAIVAGIKAPFFTRTGWPKMMGKATYGELVPLYGDYADGFWDRTLVDMPGEYADAFIMKEQRMSSVIATETFDYSKDRGSNGIEGPGYVRKEQPREYPYLTCELGGGMMTSYHRRINIFEKDPMALMFCKVASGSNMPGYYMYHGGTNPSCDKHTMGETQASSFTANNDLPYMTYDFQAPIGEMGQINPSFYWTKRYHQHLAVWGDRLCDMDTYFPDSAVVTSGKMDDGLRWTVRAADKHGSVFINNYQRMKKLSKKEGVQFNFTFSDGKQLTFPSQPITIPEGECVWFPFGMTFYGAYIDYATAMPFLRTSDEGKIPELYMASVPGVPVEISIDGKIYHFEEHDSLLLDLPSMDGKGMLYIVDQQHSKHMYHLYDYIDDYVCQDKVVYSPRKVMVNSGIFNTNTWAMGWEEVPTTTITNTLVKKTLGTRVVKIGSAKVAAMPTESDFAKAQVYEIKGFEAYKRKLADFMVNPPHTSDLKSTHEYEASATPDDDDDGVTMLLTASSLADDPDTSVEDSIRDLILDKDITRVKGQGVKAYFVSQTSVEEYFLEIRYHGDVARVYADGKLVQDNFWNGRPMLVRVADLINADGTPKKVELKILPMGKQYPIYLQSAQKKELLNWKTPFMLSLDGIKLYKRTLEKVK